VEELEVTTVEPELDEVAEDEDESDSPSEVMLIRLFKMGRKIRIYLF